MKAKEIIVFCLLLLVCLLPNILVVCMAEDVASAGQKAWYLLTTLSLYGIGFAFFHRRAYLYILSLGFVFSAFEVVHVLLRESTTTMLCLYMLFKTPPRELALMVQPYWWVMVIGVVLWVAYYAAAHRWVQREWTGAWRWRIPFGLVCFGLFLYSPVHVCPTNVLNQLGRLAATAVHVEKTLPTQRAFSYGITPNGSKADETVIVVLAETSFDQWQSLKYQDSLAIAFDSVYAECPVSGVSMPMMLTRATPGNKAPFFVERSVIKAFDEAGFFTAWLSNYGYHDHFLMRLADDCRYLMYRPNEADTVLLEGFREAMSQPSQRHMVVMATQGGKREETLAMTPQLLHQLTDSLRTTHMPAMLVYAGCPNIRMTDGRNRLHMPLMIWANPNYRYRHRPLIRALREQQHCRLSADYVFHTLLYMNDIRCHQWDEKRALGNKQMVPVDTIRYLDENLQVRRFVP